MLNVSIPDKPRSTQYPAVGEKRTSASVFLDSQVQYSIKEQQSVAAPPENVSNQAVCPSQLPPINEFTEHMNNTFVN